MAVIRDDGWVVDSNFGFQRLFDIEEGASSKDVTDYFALPTFESLVERSVTTGKVVYQGIINIGAKEATCRSLIGTVSRDGAYLILAAEFDVAELELLNTKVVQFNEQLATLQRALARRERHLRALTLTDPLTGLANRRHFEDFTQKEYLRIQRSGGTLSVIMVDIDHFKRVNDRYGHAIGDEVLRHVADLLSKGTREVDLAARFGGEEFVLLLPGTNVDGAMICAENLRISVQETQVSAFPERLSASFGVAQYQVGDTIDSLLKRADEALYVAKNGGRNRVEAAFPNAAEVESQEG
ncbi:GGDEF domain-containing protein [Chitinimonas sp. PSY-7]|uniref:diguanylate cyclase n=1 Tax=Chitinimonas sp. PSY-7 TaxID=3459088 RepID=UPI00403FF81F